MTSWHRKINQWLAPSQTIVTVGLLAIAAVAMYLALVSRNHTLRTGVLAWFLLP